MDGSDAPLAAAGRGVGSARGGARRQVADESDVDRLSARVTTTDDRTPAWSLSAETGRAFANDEITTEEFIDRVSDDLTVE